MQIQLKLLTTIDQYYNFSIDSDLSFPRLGQMIVDYEQPLRRLADEFIPHTKLLAGALRSLWPVYVQRNLTADKWR